MTSKNNRLFVGSLPYRFTEGQLLSLFVPFGRITSVVIVKNRWGKSRGMGYIEFDSIDSAVNAKEKLHGSQVEDLKIIVDFAKPDPLNTPEGQARHQEALKRRPPRPLTAKKDPSNNPTVSDRPQFYRPGSSKHVRSSVFIQRHFGSRIGKKFSQRTKKK